MRIVADNKIAYVESAFGNLGELTLAQGPAMTAETVADADILLVRSVTRVDENLLRNSKVKFVGTATIGTDHIDTDFLQAKGIVLASAPGCNSTAVAEYILTALLYLAKSQDFALTEKRLAVVGVGNVGSKVARLAKILGMKVLLNDPPLARRTGNPDYLPLDEVMHADILTLHVPLTREGEDATYHLFDDKRMSKMKSGCILLNTSRGSVVETGALKAAIVNGQLAACVLDVWEHEPDIDIELLKLTTLGTPHIAGYSLEGKVNATAMIYRAVCEFLNIEPQWNPTTASSTFEQNEIVVDPGAKDWDDILSEIVNRCYAIEEDDKKLRAMLSMPADGRSAYFEQLRAGYPLRREFSNTTVSLRTGNHEVENLLAQIGFQVNQVNYFLTRPK